MEPIIRINPGLVAGYELLLDNRPRFEDRRAWLEIYRIMPELVTAARVAARLDENQWISVNAHSWQLIAPEFQSCLLKLPVKTTVLEWTEFGDANVSRGDIECAARFLERWRVHTRGMLAIDDLGTGLDGIGRIKLIECDMIKLDGTVIEGAQQEGRIMFLMQALVETFQQMGAAVVAECVETDTALTVARSCGVQMVQGWRWEFLSGHYDPVGKTATITEQVNKGRKSVLGDPLLKQARV